MINLVEKLEAVPGENGSPMAVMTGTAVRCRASCHGQRSWAAPNSHKALTVTQTEQGQRSWVGWNSRTGRPGSAIGFYNDIFVQGDEIMAGLMSLLLRGS